MFRAISGFLVRKAKLTGRKALCGEVTLSQRFGSAPNLNLHSHKRALPSGGFSGGLIACGTRARYSDWPFSDNVGPGRCCRVLGVMFSSRSRNAANGVILTEAYRS